MGFEREKEAVMKEQTRKALAHVNETLTKAALYNNAAGLLNFDLETLCPEKAMDYESEMIAELGNVSFRLQKDPAFIADAEALYENRDELGAVDQRLAVLLHRSYLETKNITPQMDHEASLIFSKGYTDWLAAKKAADYSIFLPTFKKVRETQLALLSSRDEHKKTPYDDMFDDFEKGVTSDDLDEWFGAFKERIMPLFERIRKSPKVIRTDFLSRPVTDAQQKEFTEFILHLMQFDLSRGAYSTTEHPFTSGYGPDDARITTKYIQDSFTSSMYTVLHEGGHALFEQRQPREDYEHHIEESMSMGMHESVSRFYENRIGRSRAFCRMIFPDIQRIFAGTFDDVTADEFYEAVNKVTPSLIRTDADEFTYVFHIIIRYELEKQLVSGELSLEKAPEAWNAKYQEYLGVTPPTAREGILQDVHWASGFGYFPTYAIGNFYNAMYYNRMAQDLNIDKVVGSGDFKTLDEWMEQHVFAKANRLDPKDWIRDITGRDFTPNDFFDYLEDKYTELYQLSAAG